MKPGLAARLAAVDLLEQVVDARTPLDALTDPATGRNAYLRLPPRDRSLARAIVTVTLRRRGALERGMKRFLDRPLPRKARRLTHLMHVAAAQIVFMDAADRAAIDLAVETAKTDPRTRRFASLANAVLRRVAEAKGEIAALPPDGGDVPLWLWKAWRSDHGREAALDIIAGLRDEPALDLTLKKLDVEKPEGRLLPNGTWRVAGERTAVADLPGYDSGGWWVQDAAASLPAHLLGDVRGLTVLDACAAPGGKTAQLAARGAQVTALDRSAERLERLQENLARLKLGATIVASDLLEADLPPFDAVLLDAPCSSLGTLRRHPDVVWTKTADDVASLAVLQAQLLARALELVKPGGRLVFSTCSTMKAEGEALWQPFRVRKDVREDAIEPDEVFGLSAVTGQGTLRTLPFHTFPGTPEAVAGGMDGFFAARCRRSL